MRNKEARKRGQTALSTAELFSARAGVWVMGQSGQSPFSRGIFFTQTAGKTGCPTGRADRYSENVPSGPDFSPISPRFLRFLPISLQSRRGAHHPFLTAITVTAKTVSRAPSCAARRSPRLMRSRRSVRFCHTAIRDGAMGFPPSDSSSLRKKAARFPERPIFYFVFLERHCGVKPPWPPRRGLVVHAAGAVFAAAHGGGFLFGDFGDHCFRRQHQGCD